MYFGGTSSPKRHKRHRKTNREFKERTTVPEAKVGGATACSGHENLTAEESVVALDVAVHRTENSIQNLWTAASVFSGGAVKRAVQAAGAQVLSGGFLSGAKMHIRQPNAGNWRTDSGFECPH